MIMHVAIDALVHVRQCNCGTGEIFMLSNFEEEDVEGWEDWQWNME